MGLAVPSGLVFEELVHIESLLPFKNVIGSPSEFVSKDGEGLGFTVFSLEPFFVFHPVGVAPEEKNGSFRESPLEMDGADFLTGVPMALSG